MLNKIFTPTFAAVKAHSAEFKKFKPLIKLKVIRDYKTRYKRSALGVLWSLLNPLMTMLVLTLVFSRVFRFEIEYYPVYLLTGLLMLGFFSEATSLAMDSIYDNRSIITKVYVPKYIFPLTAVFSAFINFAFSLAALAAIILITGAPLHWTIILVPLPLLYLFAFTLGVSMLLSCAAVFFKDVKYLYGVFLTALNSLTPIFWPLEILPERALPFMRLNPMFHYISYFRSLVRYGEIPGFWANAACIGFALFFLFLGTSVFMAKQDKYILHI